MCRHLRKADEQHEEHELCSVLPRACMLTGRVTRAKHHLMADM